MIQRAVGVIGFKKRTGNVLCVHSVPCSTLTQVTDCLTKWSVDELNQVWVGLVNTWSLGVKNESKRLLNGME